MKNDKRRFLVLGAAGQLGRAFVKVLRGESQHHCFLSHQELDITDADRLQSCLKELKPDVVVNCSAYNDVDRAQTDPEPAFRVNARAVQTLAELSRKNHLFLVHYSTDYVFDGTASKPYSEDDTPNPLSRYGQSKLDGEKAVQGTLSDYLLLRVSWVFGQGKQNFLAKAAAWARTQNELKIVQDEVSVPTFTDDIVRATIQACAQGLVGLYHLTNTGFSSRYDWVRFFFEKKGFDNKIIPVLSSDFHLPARRPKFSAMSNGRLGRILPGGIPSWQDAVERFAREDLGSK